MSIIPTMAQRIEKVVAKVKQEVDAHSARKGYDDTAVAFPPASEERIRKYEEYLELKLPNSYRTFLTLHNGGKYLAYPGHMLSIEEVMPGGKFYQQIKEWKKMTADYGGTEVLDGIVIAYLDAPNDWVFLDPNKPTEVDELAVAVWLSSSRQDFPTLIEFFEWCIEVCNVDVTPYESDQENPAE